MTSNDYIVFFAPVCSSPLRLNCLAKLNLWLKVLGKRGDGYHEVNSLIVPVSLADELEISLKGDGIDVRVKGEEAPEGPANLAYRAAGLFYERLGDRPGVGIEITKRIPPGSGLGGGSSDGAGVLKGLNELHSKPFTQAELTEMGTELGSDVPFFIGGRAAVATGRGERLHPVEGLPMMWMVVAIAPYQVSTREVYGALNLPLTREPGATTIMDFGGSLEALVPLMVNDLERVTMAAHGELEQIKGELLSLGALRALMSGSGASIFGLFTDGDRAEEAGCRLKLASGWRSFLVHTV